MFAPPGVEDPISAIFDLSDRVADMAPTMRRMYRYTATVTVLFLVIMVVLLFIGLASNLFFAALALVAVLFGGIALSLLREADRFYESFLARHRSIKLLQDADPSPKIPAGRTPVERLARYLAQSSPRVGLLLHDQPHALRYRLRIAGNGAEHPFDLAIVAPDSTTYRWLGRGNAGFAIVARSIAGPSLSPEDLESFGRELQAISRRLPARLVRAILLRTDPAPLPEGVYEYAVGHPVDVRGGRVAVEIVTERADGAYDLIPYVLGVP